MKFIIASLLLVSFSSAVFSKEVKAPPKTNESLQPSLIKTAATVCKKTGHPDWKIWGNVCPDGWHR